MSVLRCEPEYLPTLTISHDVERTIRTLTHVTHPRIEVRQQTFLAHHALAVEYESHNVLARKRCDEQVALPRGEQAPIRRIYS